MVPETLRIACLHLAPDPADAPGNLARLLEAAAGAADQGARLLVAPELALSGYRLEGHDQARRKAEPLDGPSMARLAGLCRDRGLFLALGCLEWDRQAGRVHNTAVLLDPQGRLRGRHRKLVSESPWIAPGVPDAAASLAETPWGRVGLLVCADTYFALPSRALALAGADLFLVPANWPPSGLDPRRIWRARALENGVGLLVCNRTGRDGSLDCRAARSYGLTAGGAVLLDAGSPTAVTYLVDWPLEAGRFAPDRTALAGRSPAEWSSLVQAPRADLAPPPAWGAPPPEPVRLCLNPGPEDLAGNGDGIRVAVLAAGEPTRRVLDRLAGRPWPAGLVVAGADPAGPLLALPDRILRLDGRSQRLDVHRGLRLGLAPAAAMRHPEVAVVLAGQGCDLLAVPAPDLEDGLGAMVATRCLERLPVALATPRESVLFLPPPDHGPWTEVRARAPEPVRQPLDVAAFRPRWIFPRIDRERLLGCGGDRPAGGP